LPSDFDMKSLSVKILLLSFILALSCLRVNAQYTALTVISNEKGAPANLRMNEFRSVLKGERLRWPDGSKVVIALMKTNTPVGMNTCSRLYRMTANDLNKMFLALVFQGKGEAPIFFETMRELQSFVKETPGAIGIVESSAAYRDKVVNIDGKKSI
jgi:ABC-type phosphate transport system substrate-binding protein